MKEFYPHVTASSRHLMRSAGTYPRCVGEFGLFRFIVQLVRQLVTTRFHGFFLVCG